MTNPSPKSVLKRYPAGSIFQGFGENPVDYATFGLNGHNGWDILAYQGAPLVAVSDGVIWDVSDVMDAQKEADTKFNGNVVRLLTDVIDGKQYLCSYGHLDAIKCVKGQRVSAGDLIATMGNTGFVISGGVKYWGNAPGGKGVHLHLGIHEVKLSGQTINYMNSNNGFKGALDPTPFFTDTIKPEVPTEIGLMQKLVELLRSLIRSKGQEPIA